MRAVSACTTNKTAHGDHTVTRAQLHTRDQARQGRDAYSNRHPYSSSLPLRVRDPFSVHPSSPTWDRSCSCTKHNKTQSQPQRDSKRQGHAAREAPCPSQHSVAPFPRARTVPLCSQSRPADPPVAMHAYLMRQRCSVKKSKQSYTRAHKPSDLLYM